MPKYKVTQKFESSEVGPLVQRAKGLVTDLNWVNNLTPDDAKQEVTNRFLRLARSIVSVIKSGQVNGRSSFQISFLKRFVKVHTFESYAAAAVMLKSEFKETQPEELDVICNLAILQALDKTVSNFASTLVGELASIIQEELNNIKASKLVDLTEDSVPTQDNLCFSDIILFCDISSTLNQEEMDIVHDFLTGATTRLPKDIKAKLMPIFS